MGKKLSYTFGQWTFNTQTELNLTIKQIFKECPRDIEFENEFIQSLINTYHADVIKNNQKMTKIRILTWKTQVEKWNFVRDRFRGAEYVIGFFEPLNDWRGVTIYPHMRKNGINSLTCLLRQKWAESIKDIKNRPCVNHPSIIGEAHHDNITFYEIFQQCISHFTEKELKNGIEHDWLKYENEADAVSNSHPAVQKMLDLHKNVKYKYLCYDCHKMEHYHD